MDSNPPPPSARRFSQPLGGLLPVLPRGPISSRKHVQASPSGVFPHREPPRLVAAASALLPLLRAGAPLRAAHPKLDFRALLSRRVRCGRSAVKRAERPIPSWASSPPGLASPRPRTVLPRSAPHELASRPYGTALRRSSGFAQPRDGTSLARPPALLKFLALSIPQTFGRARDRAYRFASGGMPRHRDTVPHLLGPSPSPTAAA